MLLFVLLTFGLKLSYGVVHGQRINTRDYCPWQHFSDKTKVSCDGNKHFKNKNIILDSRSVQKITDFELYSFESITIISQTSSDWNHIKTIAIRNCKKITLDFQSILRLNELLIDSVDELTIESKQSSYTVMSRSISLSNIGKLNLTYSGNADIKVNALTFNNIKDINFNGNLQFSGELLTISQSNIDLMEHASLLLEFASVTVNESTRLYIQSSSKLSVSTSNFLIQESYIYMDGQINVTDYGSIKTQKAIKVQSNSIYGMKKGRLHIYGDNNEIDFIANGIYNSDISDVMALLVETENLKFSKNHFGCNKCTNKQFLQAKYLKFIGDQNYCDLTCNLTLNTYKALLDQGIICNHGEFQVDDKTLCSANIEAVINSSNGLKYVWWIVIPVLVVFIVFLCTLLYFYYKRHSPRFQAIPAIKREANQKVTVIAFNNDIYERTDNNSGNIYEIVDSPSLNR